MYNKLFTASREAEEIGYISSNLTNYSYNDEGYLTALKNNKGKLALATALGGIGVGMHFSNSFANKIVNNVDVLIIKAKEAGDTLMTKVFTSIKTLKEEGLGNSEIINTVAAKFSSAAGGVKNLFNRMLEYLS